MHAYGVRRRDFGCCPGHDKYSPDRYHTTPADRRPRNQRSRKRHARQEGRILIRKVINYEEQCIC